MVKGSHTSSILTGKDKYCYLTGEERGLSVVMGRVKDTRHGTGSGKRSGRKESEGQAYCMKRIKERAQR